MSYPIRLTVITTTCNPVAANTHGSMSGYIHIDYKVDHKQYTPDTSDEANIIIRDEIGSFINRDEISMTEKVGNVKTYTKENVIKTIIKTPIL